MRNLSYTSRLEMLGLERLETRRLHADLTICYKIVHNLVDIPFDELFKYSEHNSTRGHPLKLFQPVARINARAFFSVRIISLWNRLPVAVVQTSLARFKSQLKTIDCSYALLDKL